MPPYEGSKAVKNPTQAMDRSELDVIFLGIGGHIEFPRRTGEVIYRHPKLRHVARANGRRKDSTRHLVNYVRAVIRAMEGNSGDARSAA